MKGFSAVVAAVALPMLLTGTATARVAATDTCAATGAGTSYTLRITVAPGSQQFGFAFGAPGARITDAAISGSNGSFSTQGLPLGTSGAWISDAPVPTTSSVTLTTDKPTGGSFKIVPATTQQPVYTTPVMCTRSNVVPSRTTALKVGSSASYDSAAHVWHLRVAVPAAGTISAKQPEATVGTSTSAQITTTTDIQVRRTIVKSAGSYTLTLRATPKGLAHLRASSSMRVSLDVTFDATNGKSASKTISLTLTA
jgi:hypothetical protein